MRFREGAVASFFLAIASAGPGLASDVAALRDLGPALSACFQPPEGSTGDAVTVRFSLDARGSIIGKPRVTWSRLVGPPDKKLAFLEEALGSLGRCTPVAVSPGLGQAIAGRPITIRFIGGPGGRAA